MFNKLNIIKYNMDKTSQIFVKIDPNKILTFDLNSMLSVNQLKIEINFKTNLPLDSYYLIFAGRILDDSKLLSDYCIGNNSTIELTFRNASQFPINPPVLKRQIDEGKWHASLFSAKKCQKPCIAQYYCRPKGNEYFIATPSGKKFHGYKSEIEDGILNEGFTWDQIKGVSETLRIFNN